MDANKIKEGILYLLSRSSDTLDGMGYTFLEIRKFLELNNLKESWGKLKDFLSEMEKEDLIEERHFGGESGRVDYSIETKGIQLIETKKKDISKWKFE